MCDRDIPYSVGEIKNLGKKNKGRKKPPAFRQMVLYFVLKYFLQQT